MSRPVQRKRKESDSDDEASTSSTTKSKVKLNILPAATLRRYKKYFKVQTKPGCNKQQLADNLLEHFKTIPVNEKEILTYFIYTVKTGKNRLDNPKAAASSSNT